VVKKNKSYKFKLEVPLDASGVEDFKPEQDVKVVAKDREGTLHSQTVKLDRKGHGVATFNFPKSPGTLSVFVGPTNASDEEMEGLQTISTKVTGRLWAERQELRLSPVVIHPYYWFWWLRWCRTFTIRGLVLCPDGSPVPGAKVCSYDVDSWWMWSSKQLVGCGTTDANGAFEIKFQWCCGWWPWWWWKQRFFQLEPDLVDRIIPVLKLNPMLPGVSEPSAKPSLAVFDQLIAEEGILTGPPRDYVVSSELPQLRGQLLERLPHTPELEQLKIWPWWPWFPWWDCTPDIIFRVTQNCQGQEKVIVDEDFGDTRWNIPTTLNVTLVANEEACCVQQPDDPEGNCLVIDSVCNNLIATIGGNPPGPPGVAVVTDGFRSPGAAATWGDRPYAGRMPIYGRFGLGAIVDYYEFEWSEDDGVVWNPMPPTAAGNFKRWYYGTKLGTMDPPDWHLVDFNFSSISGRYVVESRQHFEANNDQASWGITRSWWSQTLDLLMNWLTEGVFADGRYRLRVKSWSFDGTNLINPQVLPLCDTQNSNGIVLTLDNRVVTSGSADVHGHSCGLGTIHTCTSEPDTEIISVKIIHADATETNVAACGNVSIQSTDKLQIDFAAHDPDGHLAYYTLRAHYGEGLVKNLFALGGTLSPSPLAPAWAPPAVQVGPNYGVARSMQGAVAPIWHGGAIRLTINDATLAFPETCCYLLDLRAHKRTIYNCSGSFLGHHNRSEYSFTIVV
jgi:hypothetical protein